MALEYGFFDSKNSDRRYSSADMNGIFEGVITDGIYAGVGDKFYIKPAESGLAVTIGTGRAFLHNHWIRNRNPLIITLDKADPVLSRIDAIYMVVDERDTERRCYFRVVKGTLASSPTIPPFDIIDDKVFSLRIGYVQLQPNVTRPSSGQIVNYAGTSVCPFVTSVLQQTDVSWLFKNWQDAFMDWWDNIRSVLDGDVAANLANAISLRVKYSDKATATQITNGEGTAGPDDHPLYMSPWEYYVHRISTRVDYDDLKELFNMGNTHLVGEATKNAWVNPWMLDYIIHPIVKEVIFDTAGDHQLTFSGAPLGNVLDTVILIGGGGGGGAIVSGNQYNKAPGQGRFGQVVIAHNVPTPMASKTNPLPANWGMTVRIGSGGTAGAITQTNPDSGTNVPSGGRGGRGGDTILSEGSTDSAIENDQDKLVAYGGNGGQVVAADGSGFDTAIPEVRGFANKGALNIVDNYSYEAIPNINRQIYRRIRDLSPFYIYSGRDIVSGGDTFTEFGSGGSGAYLRDSDSQLAPASNGFHGYAYIRYYTIHPELH